MINLPVFLPPHRIVSILMIALIMLTLTHGIIFIKQTVHQIPEPIEKITDTGQTSQRLITAIPDWHLFGIAPMVPANLAQTSLELDLNGVMTGDKKSAYAIIAEAGKDQKLYRTGDRLPGGAVLYQIDPQGVVIQYNSEFEQLPLVKPQNNNNQNNASSTFSSQ